MIITFTCPNCGSHQLQQIRQTIQRTEVKVTTTSGGELKTSPIGVVEELRGPVLGYRCRSCRYPDIRNHEDKSGFYWQKPEDVHEAGCLVITDGVNTPQRCMICYADGTVEPILYDGNGKATLTAEERSRILEARGATNAVLISEADPGISAFSGTDWQGVETVFI